MTSISATMRAARSGRGSGLVSRGSGLWDRGSWLVAGGSSNSPLITLHQRSVGAGISSHDSAPSLARITRAAAGKPRPELRPSHEQPAPRVSIHIDTHSSTSCVRPKSTPQYVVDSVLTNRPTGRILIRRRGQGVWRKSSQLFCTNVASPAPPSTQYQTSLPGRDAIVIV